MTPRQREIMEALERHGGSAIKVARELGLSRGTVTNVRHAVTRTPDRSGDANDLPTHVVIGDTQSKRGIPTAHLTWIGRYIVDHFAGRRNIKLIHVGDHPDMPSLSSYDKGKRAMEGRRYLEDIEAANEHWTLLNKPLVDYNAGRAKQWWPVSRDYCHGNHDQRIVRAAEDDAQLDGLLSLDALNIKASGWTTHPFLQPVIIDGVSYAHYFVHPMTGKPLGGLLETRLKTIGHSFTMGHQQTLQYALRFVQRKSQHGLVIGSSYLHEEEYLGPQGNAHWRGIVVCHGVQDGQYDPMFVRMDYLCRRYERMSLEEFMKKTKGAA